MSKDFIDLSKLGKPEEKIVGVEAMCWSCNKIWNVTLLPVGSMDVKCTCGGYVVTPSGKIMSRPIKESEMPNSPLLEIEKGGNDE